MEIKDINPFLRYASRIKYIPASYDVCAVDYHFYYVFAETNLVIESVAYQLNRGSVIILPPGTQYQFKDEKPVEAVSINFDYTHNNSDLREGIEPISVDKFNENEILEILDFEEFEFLNHPLIVSNMSYIENLVEAVISEFICKKIFHREKSAGIFKEIIFEILRTVLSGNINNQKINDVIEYIHNHYAEDIDNNKLGEVAGYHSYYLNRIMKKTAGTTLRQYIINYRMQCAKKFLKETDFQVCEISEMCGYKNFSSFSSDFKRKYGVSPSLYRNETKNIF